MRLLEDERGVTVQIGAILMFAILVILFSTYQAYVVPQENEAIEFQHSQEVESDLVAVRNAILSAASSGGGRPTSVTLGVQYPVRALFVNPPPATGTLQTERVGNGTISISNVTATGKSAAREFFGEQSNTLTYPTQSLVYNGQYNVYGGAPSRVLENGLLYNDFEDVHTVPSASNQVLVDDTTITLVALNGSYFQNGVTASAVDPSVLSGPYNPVGVTNTTGNVTITFSSRMPASEWRSRTSLNATKQEHIVSVTQAGNDTIAVELESGVDYRLRAAKIGVGSDTVTPDPAYVTRVGQNGNVVTLEVRDKYNNPYTKRSVDVSFVGGSKPTGENGRVTFTVSESGSYPATIPGTNVSTTITVENTTQGGSGDGPGGQQPSNIYWDEDRINAASEYVSCTRNAGDVNCNVSTAISNQEVPLYVAFNDSRSFANVDFSASGDSGVITALDPSSNESNATGVTVTRAKIDQLGTATVYATSASDSATLTLTVTEASGPVARLDILLFQQGSEGNPNTYEFDASASTGDITEYQWDFDNDGEIETTTQTPTTQTTRNRPSSGTGSVTVVGPNGTSTATAQYPETYQSVTTLSYPAIYDSGGSGSTTSIPPSSAYGALQNFQQMQAADGDRAEINTDHLNGTIEQAFRIGVANQSVPSRPNYQLDIRYYVDQGQGHPMELLLVKEDGTIMQKISLDQDQEGQAQEEEDTYVLNSNVEQYIRDTGSYYVVVNAPPSGQDGQYINLYIDYIRVRGTNN